MDYARRLAAKAEELRDDLQIVMRVLLREAAHHAGLEGPAQRPRLDGTFDINTGLRMGRKLLLDISRLGLPVGCEFLDPIIPQYIADLVTYGAIGARTAASQVHRQLCSALSMPVVSRTPPRATSRLRSTAPAPRPRPRATSSRAPISRGRPR